jgi:hypothetical protein
LNLLEQAHAFDDACGVVPDVDRCAAPVQAFPNLDDRDVVAEPLFIQYAVASPAKLAPEMSTFLFGAAVAEAASSCTRIV